MRRKRQVHFSQHRLQNLRHIFHIHICFFQPRWGAVREILHQQEIDLVAIAVGLLGFVQMMQQQHPQAFIAGQGGGLQELAQLMNLNALVHILEPLPRLLDRLARRSVHPRFEIRARRQFDHKFMRQRGIQRIQYPRVLPFGSQFRQR